MSMSVGSGNGEDRGIMSEINTTPLVDVMLVLLIIFLITIPVITKNVPVSVPKAVNIPTQTKPERRSRCRSLRSTFARTPRPIIRTSAR
jgi:biopolymer transport protein ExbD